MEKNSLNTIPELLRNIDYTAADIFKTRVYVEGLIIYEENEILWTTDIKKTLLLSELNDFILTPSNYIHSSAFEKDNIYYMVARAFPVSKRGMLKLSTLRMKNQHKGKRLLLPTFSYEYMRPSLHINIQKDILRIAAVNLIELPFRTDRTMPLGLTKSVWNERDIR
jgi:hypothetical protein